MADTKIEWCDKSWNPIAGCTKCSPGCLNCYAERMAHRLKYICLATNNNPQYLGKTDDDGHWTGEVECCDWILDQPLKWRKPKRIFVCSTSDLFHKKVPFGFINKVINRIYDCPQHTFLILTKRANRMLEYYNQVLKGYLQRENIHPGVSISNQAEADEKIPILLQIPATVRWLSIEPLLSEIDLTAWLNCDTLKIKKEKCNERKRIDVFEPSSIRDVQHRQTRLPMETQILGGGQPHGNGLSIKEASKSKAGGEVNFEQTSKNPVYDESEEICNICTQSSVDDVSPTINSGLPRNKSHRRQPSKQQSRKSRIGNTSTEYSSCRQGFEGDGQEGTAGEKECDGEANTARGERNKATMQEQKFTTERNSKVVRGGSKSNIKNTSQQKLDWVVVGGESGPGVRYCPIENIRGIVEQCKATSVPVFVKQIHLDGKAKAVKDINQFPEDLRIQQLLERR